jgi:hypothetical protein
MDGSPRRMRRYWIGIALIVSAAEAPAGAQTPPGMSTVRVSATVLPPSFPSSLAIRPAPAAIRTAMAESIIISLCHRDSHAGWTATVAVETASAAGAELEWKYGGSDGWEPLSTAGAVLGSATRECEARLRVVPASRGAPPDGPVRGPLWVTVQFTADRT